MQQQYRVIEITRRDVVAQPLDGASLQTLKVRSPRKYVEHEILIVRLPEAEAQAGAAEARVVSSRIDPSFLGIRPLKLLDRDEPEWEFEEPLSFKEGEEFEEALDCFRDGDYMEAGKLLSGFLKKHPLHIDTYHHLGVMEWDLGRLDRGRKYFETGYKIGLLSIPEGFQGTLPWARIANRPFLRAAHGYALALLKQKRALEACEVLERIPALNPNDNQGVRFLLPELYLAARAPAKARALLERVGPEGMNLYTFALLEILDGRPREALRCLCRGAAYNPYVLNLILSKETFASIRADVGYVQMGGRDEAEEYLHKLLPHWRKKPALEFLKRLLAPGPFRERLDRVLQMHEELEGMPVGDERSAIVNGMFSVFCEEAIPKILSECQALL